MTLREADFGPCLQRDFRYEVWLPGIIASLNRPTNPFGSWLCDSEAVRHVLSSDFPIYNTVDGVNTGHDQRTSRHVGR